MRDNGYAPVSKTNDMKRHWRVLLLILVGFLASYAVFATLRARSNLITLSVRDADLRSVVHQLERQTWEDIFLVPEVQGRVTLTAILIVHRDHPV